MMDGLAAGEVPGSAWWAACLLALAACTAEPPATGGRAGAAPDEVAEDRPILPPTLPGLPGLRLPALALPNLFPAPAPPEPAVGPAGQPAGQPALAAAEPAPPASSPGLSPDQSPALSPGPSTGPSTGPAPDPAPAAAPEPPALIAAPATGQAAEPVLAMPVTAASGPSAPAGETPPVPRPLRDPIRVQLVAAGSEAEAMRFWSALAQRVPDLVQGRQPLLTPAERPGARTVWRLRVGDFATGAEAASYCARLRARGQECWVSG